MIIALLMLSMASSIATSSNQDDQNNKFYLAHIISVFIHFAGTDESLTNITEDSFIEAVPGRGDNKEQIIIEFSDSYTRISGSENMNISTDRLNEKPVELKEPPFKPLLYMDIHPENSPNSSAVIRIYNEWQRSDLSIYHYADNDWQRLETVINGDYLEAVTGSFSIFAVGAPGGINIHLHSDTLILAGDTITIAGAAYYNNSTAANAINIEIDPSWSAPFNITTDQQGNFLQALTGPELPGNYTLYANASSGILSGSNNTIIQVTNATIYRTNATAGITNNMIVGAFASISFPFPEDAVPELSNISLDLNSSSSIEIKVNNITLYNSTTSSANLDITGYLAPQNEINITVSSPVNLTYALDLGFHRTATAPVTKTTYYSASLNITNAMSYDWNDTSISYHIPDGSYDVSVWENGTNLTGNSIVSGNILRVHGIGKIYNNSVRNIKANYNLKPLDINITLDREEIESGEIVFITPGVYFNGSGMNTVARIIIYRDSAAVYETNVTSGSTFSYSDTIAGVYNITAYASMNIDGIERTGYNRTFIHVKNLLIYINADPALSGRQVKITGRAYYTNNSGYAGIINIGTGNESYVTTSNATGYFSYNIPGKIAGTYSISATASAGNYTASANAVSRVLDNYFYLVKGDLPVISGDVTLAPDAMLWVNQTNITRASLYLYCKTAIHLLYDPLPVTHQLIPTNLNSYISGTFKLPLYPYDYLEILSAFLNTTAEEPVNTVQDFAYNVTIDDREVNSLIIPHGDAYFTRNDNIRGFIPDFLKPGNTQTIKIFNKNTGSSQQYFFTEELYVDYIGHISSPCDLFLKTNDNLTYANIGNFTNATVDFTGIRSATNNIRLNNCRRTSIIGYNITLQKQYFGYTTHTAIEDTGRYNVTDTAIFTPGTNLTSVTIIIPLVEKAKDVGIFVNGTDLTANVTINDDLELFLPEVNSTKVINITYWIPVLDFAPSANKTQFNRGDTAQLKADITYAGSNVSDAVAYASISKAGAAVADVALNFSYGGTYSADYAISPVAEFGVYNITVWAYNATTVVDSENTTFRVRGLNVTANAGGPYMVDTNASVRGYVKDIENSSNINGSSVNITIWNDTFYFSTATTSNSTGYYNLTRPLDAAGDYNITVTAFDNNIRGIANTTYKVKYNVSVPVTQASFNKDSPVPVNIIVYDRSLLPVPGAVVNSTVNILNWYFYYNGTTDPDGRFNFTQNNTGIYGKYNITVNVSKDNIIGNASVSFRIKGFNLTVNAGGPYQVDKNASISGYVKDVENNTNINGASVNITIWNSTFNHSSSVSSNATGYYNLTQPVDVAGDYNVFVNASLGGINGSVNSTYRVKYNVSVRIPQASYNKNSSVPVNITVYDRSLLPVTDVTVRSTVNILNQSFYYNGSTDIDGRFNFTHGQTSNYGKYNITVNVSKDNIIGNATANFQVSALVVTANTQPEYNAGNTILINGTVIDGGTGIKVTGAIVNVTLDNGSLAAFKNTTTSAGNYSATFVNLSAGVYTAYVDVTYAPFSGSAIKAFDIHYNVNTSINRSIFSVGEEVPINITVSDVNNQPAQANISMEIRKPDSGLENVYGSTANGFFTSTFTNSSIEGDYTIIVNARNDSTSAHGDAVNRIFRASGFFVNASFDRDPVSYKPGETVNIKGLLRDTLGSWRVADVAIRINDPAGSEVANTTLYNMKGSFALNYTLAGDSGSGWYTVTVAAITSEGVASSTTTQFEVQLKLDINTGVQYNPDDEVDLNIQVRNGTEEESAAVNVTVQKFDIWNEFTGTYFDTGKMTLTTPDLNNGYYLNFSQDNDLAFYTQSLAPANTWVGKAIMLNATTLPSRFIFDYETTTSGTSNYLLTRPTIGNSTNYVALNFLNYSNNSQDGYDVYTNSSGTWTNRYSKRETTNNRKVHFSIEYNMGTLRFYKDHEQFYQFNYTLAANSVIKLNGYTQNPITGTNAYVKFDNVTLYDFGSPVQNQGTASGSSGNYTFNFTAGSTGMYRINAAAGNSSAYTTFLVRTLDVTSILYGPYNFNESTLSNNTIVPLIVRGTVKDTETHAGISGAQVNVSISQNGSIYAYRAALSDSGNFSFNFTGDLNSTASGIFNVSVGANDNGILAVNNSSITAYTINQTWFDPYRDYRIPILLYNNGPGEKQGIVTFNLALPGGYAPGSVGLYDIEGNITPANIIDMGTFVNITFSSSLGAYEGNVLYIYFERPDPASPHGYAISSFSAPCNAANGTIEGYALNIDPDRNAYSAGENVILATQIQDITGNSIVTDVTTKVYYPNGTLAQVNNTPANDTGVALANYTIPSLKGSFTAVASATVNGVMRMEKTNFNVGNITVIIDSDKPVYNTLEKVTISVNASESGNTTSMDVNLKIFDPNNVKVFEETKNAISSQTSTINSQGSEAWQYAGAGIPIPSNGNWVVAASNEKGAISSNDTNIWETRRTTGHDQYDYQMYRFQFTQPVDKIINLTARWIGYGEGTINYDVSLYIWNYYTSSWEQLDKEYLASEGTLLGQKQENINNYVDSNGFVYVSAGSRHCDYAPVINSYYVNGWGLISASASDQDGDTVEYYYRNDNGNSGWTTATSWAGGTPGCYAGWTYYVKARANGIETAEINAGYIYGGDCYPDSCPFVYTWNGTGYEYVTDLGGLGLGSARAITGTNYDLYYVIPAPEMTGGKYDIRIRENLAESDFFDYLKLIIADVPEGYSVFNTFQSKRSDGWQWHIDSTDGIKHNSIENDLITFNDATTRTPITAYNKTGANVADRLANIDNYPVRESGQQDQEYVLDFGNIEHPEYAKLLLWSWTYFNTTEQNIPMTLYVINSTRMWEQVADLGIPTGDLHPYAYNISNIWKTSDRRIKLIPMYKPATMNIIDKIALDDSAPVTIQKTVLNVSSSVLRHSDEGVNEYKDPTTQERFLVGNLIPDKKNYYQFGNYTKYGEVASLLSSVDDKFVVVRHGDELLVSFEGVPKKNNNINRVFILDSLVYCVMVDSSIGHIDNIDLMPFKNMTKYPYSTGVENYPYDEEHNRYLREWNTRACEDRVGGTCYNSSTGKQILNAKSENVTKKPLPRSLNTNYIEVTAALAVPVEFNYTLQGLIPGKYTVTASASKTGNAGYNSTVFELDQFDINASTNKPVYSSGENIRVSGTTIYRGGNANANVNLNVKKNLAYSPSFETDIDNNAQPDGWTFAGSPWNGTGTRDTISRTGSYSVKVRRYPANTTEGLWYYPNMYVISPDINYEFSVWAKTDNVTGGNVRLWVVWYNGTVTLSTALDTQKNIRAQDGWVLIDGKATSPANATNARVHLVSNIVGSAWFDDVDIEPGNNPVIYTANTVSNGSYDFSFSLLNESSYIVYANGSFAANGTLNRINTTIITVRSLDINSSASGPLNPGAGSVLITGFIVDKSTRMAVPGAAVSINITYPDGSLQGFARTSNTQGYYNLSMNTPFPGGTYRVNISAKDYQDITGTANTTFRVRLNVSVQANKIQYDPGETVQITVNVNNNSAGISGATLNLTVTPPSGTGRSFSTLYGNITDLGNGIYSAAYPDTRILGNYTINASVSRIPDDGFASSQFNVKSLNVTIQGLQATVGESRPIYARVEDGITHATINNATVNITISNATSVVNQTNTTSGNSGYNIVTNAYTVAAGTYNVTINVTGQNNVRGSAGMTYNVNLGVGITLNSATYDPDKDISATIAVRESLASMSGGATVVTNLTYYNGTVISSNTTTTHSSGILIAGFKAPGEYSSYFINVTATKNGINGTASRLFATSNLRIWTDKGEAIIGSPVWAANAAPEKYRNLTIKVAVLAGSGMRSKGQNLTAKVYKPDGTIFGNYLLAENDKIYTASILLPGNNIPEGNYTIRVAEYPGYEGNFSVIIWGCARCHGPNAGGYDDMWGEYSHTHTSSPSTFNIDHNHATLVGNSCNNCHGEPSCGPNCHFGAIQSCATCHNSPNTNLGFLNSTYGTDLHANINTKPGGQWYGKATACESCHGTLNSTQKPGVPLCTNCHPNSSGSDMKVMPGGLRGSNATLEDFEEVSDVIGTSGYRYSTVSIATDTNKHNGSYSAKVDYGFGPGFGRIYIDKKNLGLTNATKIILWVYGDNSGINLSISLNNTRSSKISWHQSAPVKINWTGWRKISFNINELSQSDLMYISYADTVRIKLESNSGGSGTIFIDDLGKEAVGSHTQYDEVECGVCHGGRHNIKRAPQCRDCHQTQEHGWPNADKYPGDNASCMQCHQAGSAQNMINISNISEHTELVEDFESPGLFNTSLTSFSRSDEYYGGDEGNHSARLDYAGLIGYRGNSVNVTNSSKFKGISVFVNASNDPATRLVLGVYTTKWNNYTISTDWNGWKEINVLYHNITVNESISFNATGAPSRIWMGVYGINATGTIYIDDLRQAVSDDYHQYESWKCTDCHVLIKNLPGITDITSPITDCSLCHNLKEPHYKQFTRVCMDCHFDSRHAEVEDGNLTNYEKASTCLKCHTVPHDFNETHLETADCNKCHQQRIHGQNYQNVAYNKSLHLDCERCHGKTTAEEPLPTGLGSPRTTILRLSYTYNNETQCLICHKDRIFSYELHINTSVNRSDQDLVGKILNDSICTDCHGKKSLLIESDRDELTAIDPMREPHAPQVEGHGNVSCYKCHGHRPETLTLNYGSNCVGCHQNTNELTELMPGTMNNSRLSVVTNPGAKQLIVHPPQVTGHGNASCSNCHGHVNPNLTYIGSKASECANCHENTSMVNPLLPFRDPNSTRSTITNQGGNPVYVNPPQVLGHGNTSCRECHEHAPSTFNAYDFIEGTVCEDCHQNMSRNVSLIEETVPNSNRTKLVDNHTMISPQVAGHGSTACSVCHSHSAERMVYYGGRNTDCISCHFNESSEYTLLRNGSSVKSTQITPHRDMNCTECHGHTPSNMTRVNDCRLCHQNATMAQSLSETYGTGLNMTSPGNNITAVQVPFLQHGNSESAGRKWNKTVAYWMNGSDSCQYCHKISVNYSDHDPLGRASAIAGNNHKNSSLANSYWCAACHYQDYSSGNVTYDDVVATFVKAGLPVPPEITSNSSYGNYSTSNDGVRYYAHGLSDYSDFTCAKCHGHAGNSTEFLHSVTQGTGGSACLNCHENETGPVDDPDKYPGIVKSLFNDHKNLNTANGSGIVDDGDCIVCHYNTTDMDRPGWTTPTKNCNDCHINGNYSAPEIDNHRQGAAIPTNVYCSACHINSINEYNYSINASISHYGTNTSLVTTVNRTQKPEFGFMTQADAQKYNKDCNNCHNPSNSSYGNATQILTPHISRATCNECHVDGNASDLHNGSLGMPVTFNCRSCHTTYADKYGAPNMTGTLMASKSSCQGSGCHGDGITDSMDTLARHNYNRNYAGTPGITDTVYLNGQASISVTKGSQVYITTRVNDYNAFGTTASRVGGAEYYIDVDLGQGKGIPMVAADGYYDAVNANWENVTASLDTNALSDGSHKIYVRGMDIGKQWSAPKNATLFIQSSGYINGTVMNDSAAVPGVYVYIPGANDTTGSDGNYSVRVFAGTYTVNASKLPEYNNFSVSGIVVTPLNTTILDITIQEKLAGTIRGTVRNI